VRRTSSTRLISAALLLATSWMLSLAPAVLAADTPALIRAAQKQFESGTYATAITTLQSAISQSPSSAEAYYWLGRCYYEIRDYDRAVTNAEKSVALDSKNSLYDQWLGRIYGGKADHDTSYFLARRVKKEFAEAVRLNPSNTAARRDLEQFCIDAPWIVGGSKDEARQQVDAIAALDPIEGHLALAVYDQEGIKRPDLAGNEYRQVIDAKPKTIDPYLEAAGFFQGQNKPSDMEVAIQVAAQVSPKDPRLAYYRASANILLGQDLARADEYLKSYLASTPDRSDWPSHASAREWLGRLYEAQGRRADAAEQYRAALQLDPGRKEAKSRLEKLEKTSK
jgi:tetratricopeptide (TPR) repeat protein